MKIRLTRTGKPDLQFDGTEIAKLESSGKPQDMADTRHSRWFEWGLYFTDSGKVVAHIAYRAGQMLRRELPVDHVVVGIDAADLLAQLTALDWKSWVSGWPRDGRYDDRNETLFRRMQNEWQQMLTRASDAVKPTEVEELT